MEKNQQKDRARNIWFFLWKKGGKREKGITPEELKSIGANNPDKYALVKAEAKAWLKGQEGFMPNLPRLEKITEKPQATTQG